MLSLIHAANLNLTHIGADDRGIAFHILAGGGGETGFQNAVSVGEALQIVFLRAADHFADAAEGIVVMKLPDHGRAEFVGHMSLQKEGDAFPDLENIIRTLEARHLSKDPFLANDKRYKGHYLYEFKTMAFDKYWAYIKVFIKEFEDEKKVVVAVSLHESDNVKYEV